MESESCGTCGAKLAGRYCHQCGEAATHHGDLGLRHLTHDFLHEFTHVDGKILRTLIALLFAPGKLTAEYWKGRRGMWVRPLRLYLVISALQMLLAANASGPLGLRVWKHGDNLFVGSNPPVNLRASPVDQEMNHRIQSIYVWVRYLSLGLFAVACWTVYRKFQPWYGAHLIFVLHYYSFEYILTGLMSRLSLESFAQAAALPGFIYLLLALRTVYRQRFLITFGKTLVLFFAVGLTETAVLLGAVLLANQMSPHQ